jgi:hypothetical protein
VEIGDIDWAQSPPTENLRLEFKSWINPSDTADKAKVVKALLALRNRNGGVLMIGIDNGSSVPLGPAPYDVRSVFHADLIQLLVTTHSSDAFEVDVQFQKIVGVEYPVITVPAGVRVPAVVKRGIEHGGKDILRKGDVLFRTTLANATVSSAPCQVEDWRDLMDVCFENREADIGAFLRRHLSGSGIDQILATLSSAAGRKQSPTDDARELLIHGHRRLVERLTEKGVPDGKHGRLSWGGLEVAVVIDPPLNGYAPNVGFRNMILDGATPLTGLQTWPDTRNWTEESSRPDVHDGAWETMLDVVGLWSFLGFTIMDPRGRFYAWRSFDDDASAGQRGDVVGRHFDPLQATKQIIEVLATSLLFCRALGVADAHHKIHLAFKWHRLKGRDLWGYFSRGLILHGPNTASGDLTGPVTSTLPADLALSALAPVAMEVAAPMLATFKGFELAPIYVDEALEQMLSRANLV